MTDQELIEAAENRLEEKLPPRELYDYAPEHRIERAAAIATPLAEMIEKQNMYEEITPGKKYVKVEGWQAVITLCGLRIREDRHVVDDTGVTVWVSIVDRHGDTIGEGAGMVGVDETQHQNIKAFQRRSLANSRAISRAARNCLGWVVSLAGYEVTPHTEMEGVSLPPVTGGSDKPPLVRQVEAAIHSVTDLATCKRFRERLNQIAADLGPVEFQRLSMMLTEAEREIEASQDGSVF